MRPITNLFSTLPSVFLNIGIVSLLCVTYVSSDDNDLENLKLLKSIEGVEEDGFGAADFDPQSNATALEVLRKSSEFQRFFHADGLIFYPNVSKNGNTLFAFLLPIMNDEAQLTVVFTPCGSLPITWRLLYRPPSTDQSTGVFSESSENKRLCEYNGVEPSIFQRTVAQGGLYLVQVLSKENTAVQIHASTVVGGQTIVNISNFRINTQIKFKLLFDMDSPTARLLLPALNIDLEQFYLVFVISRKKFYNSLCSVMSSHPDRREYVDEDVSCHNLQNDSELQVCRADGHRTLIDLKLEPNQTYYISVFAWDMSNGLSVPYSRVNFNFRKSPVRLRDGIPQRINVTTSGGKVSFKYKIRKNSTGNNTKLFFYVFPCAGMGTITVEAKHKKSLVLRKQISEYEKFEIVKPLAYHRYVIIIRSGSSKMVRQCDSVEVMATVRPDAFPLPPRYPSDVRVNVTVSSTCTRTASAKNDVFYSINISWLPIITKEILLYCLFMKEIPTNETSVNVFTSTEAFYSLLTKERKSLGCKELSKWNKSQPFAVNVKEMKPRVNYAVQVIVKKPKQWERFLSYDILNGVHSDCSKHLVQQI